jgi:hypothetical protein
MTNLHLGNRRLDAGRLRDRMAPENWRSSLATCEQALALFPASMYAGVDVLVMPGLRKHAVLEINAFGDLLPGILFDDQDTYAAEVAAVSDY